MKTKDFYYELPEELIAQDPLTDRSGSRLLILDKETGAIEHRIFRQITQYLKKGDCLVVNNTKVIPARLIGEKLHIQNRNSSGEEEHGPDISGEEHGNDISGEVRDHNILGEKLAHDNSGEVQNKGISGEEQSLDISGDGIHGAKIELLLLKRRENDIWETLVKPGKKARTGTKVSFGKGILTGEIIDVLEEGNRLVKFTYQGIFEEILDLLGEMPLPPYITHELTDKNRYQTVYAKYEGSAAAPTAGLHFTKELLTEIEELGIPIVNVTLHVGLGTFRPVKVENVLEHHMHSEFYQVTEDAADIINSTKRNGGRVICVGTTSCRTVESAADEQGLVRAGSGDTSIFIYPGYQFTVMDALITNFHLPESTLMMLVSALAGREHIMAAYEEAVKERYRFFSFGDAMFIH